ncbi:hypothetical protein JKP88DRAFT_263176 [Tribonema minus]|uniref:Uncharacterized protein n=1 Tax=Tribonema minus TaxID=303371 RepID=A0A835YYW9_9STRA|nr:hypothetical protein JKP88DRAFT_263176 [Tribonema minus]
MYRRWLACLIAATGATYFQEFCLRITFHFRDRGSRQKQKERTTPVRYVLALLLQGVSAGHCLAAALPCCSSNVHGVVSRSLLVDAACARDTGGVHAESSCCYASAAGQPPRQVARLRLRGGSRGGARRAQPAGAGPLRGRTRGAIAWSAQCGVTAEHHHICLEVGKMNQQKICRIRNTLRVRSSRRKDTMSVELILARFCSRDFPADDASFDEWWQQLPQAMQSRYSLDACELHDGAKRLVFQLHTETFGIVHGFIMYDDVLSRRKGFQIAVVHPASLQTWGGVTRKQLATKLRMDPHRF